MKITKINEKDVLVVTLCGRLNFLSCDEVERLCNEVEDDVKIVIFDFGLLDYISGDGLLLIEKIKKNFDNRKISFSIRNTKENLMRLFRRTKLDEIIDVS